VLALNVESSEALATVESATQSDAETRSDETPVPTIALDTTNTKRTGPERNVDPPANAENASAAKTSMSPESTMSTTETVVDDASATLPSIKTLATLEASAPMPPEPAPSAANDTSSEPIQVSLFDFDVMPEPERKVLGA
jgi:hypothetical protein